MTNYCEEILMSSKSSSSSSSSSSFSVDSKIRRQERTPVHLLQTIHEAFFINMPCAGVQLQMRKEALEVEVECCK